MSNFSVLLSVHENSGKGLTHINLAFFCGTKANSTEQGQMPKDAASDQVPHCYLTEVSFKI